MTRDQLTALGFKFAYSIPLKPEPKFAAATKRDMTSVFINLVLSQSEEKTKRSLKILKGQSSKWHEENNQEVMLLCI